ncbi:hypothetical protein LTR62_008118 [Meristemomyces frigidus]|uniref:Uncharacterized protein n=1 Tax=Meristemomyces frigidus TaxID=1508187 RepID=A0AAN7YCV8_9PEZI|nr:hypothetical protein LTR62_008118 [Meristemomyces frigidus]
MASTVPPQAVRASGPNNEPRVQHKFDGDAKILNSTFDERMALRKTLSDLHQLLQRLEGQNVQIAAEIKLRVAGPQGKEHTYSVTIDDRTIDSPAFASQFQFGKHDSHGSPNGVTNAAAETNHKQLSPGRAREDDTDDEVCEVNPPKRARTDDGVTASAAARNKSTDRLLREALAVLQQHKSDDTTLDFIEQWHGEWVKQGGWLFDTLNGLDKLSREQHANVYARINVVQDVLGQSINAASASTLNELTSISKLIPWLEQCRKLAADKTQAREEKWRSSSATFHDKSRKDRETAEKRLEDELQKQRALLVKIAEANGIDVDEEDAKEDAGSTREASLGAQLTAELELQASRAAERLVAQEVQSRNPITIDDDEAT